MRVLLQRAVQPCDGRPHRRAAACALNDADGEAVPIFGVSEIAYLNCNTRRGRPGSRDVLRMASETDLKVDTLPVPRFGDSLPHPALALVYIHREGRAGLRWLPDSIKRSS